MLMVTDFFLFSDTSRESIIAGAEPALEGRRLRGCPAPPGFSDIRG